MEWTRKQRLVYHRQNAGAGGVGARGMRGDDRHDGGGDIPISPVAYGWDEEERETAWRQARDLAKHDPDAAAVLMAHLEATAGQPRRVRGERDQDEEDQEDDDVTAPLRRGAKRPPQFDPARLIARVAHEYGWTDAAVLATPWRRLLMYAREASILHEEEDEAYREAMRRNGGTEDTGAGARDGSRGEYGG